MARRKSKTVDLAPSARQLEAPLHALGGHDHVAVRAARGHLLIEIHEEDAPPDVLVRATPLGGGDFGPSFRSHSGRWEPMPVVGTIADVADGVADPLAPSLDPRNR